MVLLLPSVLAAALSRTLDSHGHSAKKKSYASASCVRSVSNDMEEFNFAQGMHGFYFSFSLLKRARPSSSLPPLALFPGLSLWFCVSSLLIMAARNAGDLHREAFQSSL